LSKPDGKQQGDALLAQQSYVRAIAAVAEKIPKFGQIGIAVLLHDITLALDFLRLIDVFGTAF
jgi:hypothetical protein